MTNRKKLVETFIKTAIDSSRETDFSMFHDHVIIHTPIGRKVTIAELNDDIKIWKTAFPDLSVSDVTMKELGDVVISHNIAHGTHLNPFNGIPPTEKTVAVSVETTFCFEGDLIARYLPQLNMQDLFVQLGLAELQKAPVEKPIKEREQQRLLSHLKLQLNLTSRPIECLALYLTGFSSKQIGERFNLSPRTVETHFQNSFTKIGCNSKHACIEHMVNRDLLASLHDLATLYL